MKPTDLGLPASKLCTSCLVPKPLTEFHSRGLGTKSHCKECVKKARKRWLNRQTPERRAEIYSRESARKTANKYGLTLQEHRCRLKLPCEICGALILSKGGHGMHLDHNHVTGKTRGTLCHVHNKALGLFGDDIELLIKAVEYLVKYEAN